MALHQVHLRKILKIMFLPPVQRRSEIRRDIREEVARASGQSGGGDFYVPFWADAKAHAFGVLDLSHAIDDRIAINDRRETLYPRLRDGFLTYWNERRRWTNKPFTKGQSLKGNLEFQGLGATVKVDNILVVKDGLGDEHAIYPYFSPNPVLSDEAARLGLWLLSQATTGIPYTELRILDVIRGKAFALDRLPLDGTEEAYFKRRYRQILNEREILRADYPDPG